MYSYLACRYQAFGVQVISNYSNNKREYKIGVSQKETSQICLVHLKLKSNLHKHDHSKTNEMT